MGAGGGGGRGGRTEGTKHTQQQSCVRAWDAYCTWGLFGTEMGDGLALFETTTRGR